jgi:hypothetical protein
MSRNYQSLKSWKFSLSHLLIKQPGSPGGNVARCIALAFGLNNPLPLVAGIYWHFCFVFQLIRCKDFLTISLLFYRLIPATNRSGFGSRDGSPIRGAAVYRCPPEGSMLLHRSMPSASVGKIFPIDADRTKGAERQTARRGFPAPPIPVCQLAIPKWYLGAVNK